MNPGQIENAAPNWMLPGNLKIVFICEWDKNKSIQIGIESSDLQKNF